MSQKGNKDKTLLPAYSHSGTTQESLGFCSFSLTSNTCPFHAIIFLIRDMAFTKGMVMTINVIHRTCYFIKKYLIKQKDENGSWVIRRSNDRIKAKYLYHYYKTCGLFSMQLLSTQYIIGV